jgi:hypothetical protein
VVKEKADLLAEPDPGAEVVQPLEQLAVIEVIAEDNPDYYQVRLKDDQEVVGFLVKENVGIRCQGACAVG